MDETGHDFQNAIKDGNIDLADAEWHKIAESALIQVAKNHSDTRKKAPPRGQPLPRHKVKIVNQWSEELEQEYSGVSALFARLLGSARDLRARLNRWTKKLPTQDDEDHAGRIVSRGVRDTGAEALQVIAGAATRTSQRLLSSEATRRPDWARAPIDVEKALLQGARAWASSPARHPAR